MLEELVLRNRSYRSYDETRKISRDELLNFVNLARRTPSSRNQQPLCYRLVHTAEECAKVLPLTGWAALLNLKLPPDGHAPTAYIIICCDINIATPNFEKFWRDVGITAQTITLAAAESGLGGCMIGNFSPEKINSALNIPEKYRPMLVIALGKPDETIKLVDAENGKINYYREDGIHIVPKRPLDEIIIN